MNDLCHPDADYNVYRIEVEASGIYIFVSCRQCGRREKRKVTDHTILRNIKQHKKQVSQRVRLESGVN